MDEQLIDKLVKLSELEIKKSKVLAILFQKMMQERVSQKIQNLKRDFEEQAKFYGQKIEDYEEIYQKIMTKYEEQLAKIVEPYQEWYMNLYLELQEAQCNQKIAMINQKKSYDIKQEFVHRAQPKKVEEYHKKICACLQKKDNYHLIIEECEKRLDECMMKLKNEIQLFFRDRSGQVLVKQESGLAKIMNKIRNLFSGKNKFNTYVLEPIQVELEMMDDKLPDKTEQVQEETVNIIAKIKQAKAQTNQIFENMM